MSKEKKENDVIDVEPDTKNTVSKKTEGTVSITFRQNRKFDLHIGRDVIVFLGRETKNVPASILKHRDWQNVSKYFIVKGV